MKIYYNESTGGRYTPSIFICQFVSLSVRQLPRSGRGEIGNACVDILRYKKKKLVWGLFSVERGG